MSAIVLADPSLVLLVGPAGAGKTTLARRRFAPGEILSSDALRAAVSGDESDQSASRAAFAVLHRELARRLSAGHLTVVDATNLRGEHRRPLIRRARDAGVPTAAIVLDLPRAVVLAQNAGRRRVVPELVIARQLSWLRDTIDGGRLSAEGVRPVIVLRTIDEVSALDVIRIGGDPPG